MPPDRPNPSVPIQPAITGRGVPTEESPVLETSQDTQPTGHWTARLAVILDLGLGAALMVFAMTPALVSIFQVARRPDPASLLLVVFVVLSVVPALFGIALPFLLLATTARWAGRRSAAGGWIALLSACVTPILVVLRLDLGKMPVPQLMALAPTVYCVAVAGSVATMLPAVCARVGAPTLEAPPPIDPQNNRPE